MLHVHLAHSLSLNDVADTLRNHSGVLTTIRRATPPSRNGLSHANRVRDPEMAQALFWEVLSHIQSQHPDFGRGHQYSGLPKRFKRTIYSIDSTTIQLVANCMDWAKHRRRKAAAKCHMQLNLHTFLPQFAIVKEASTHDSTEAYQLCSNLKDGEIEVFDKAYVDFGHLANLDERGVLWVTRAKDNMSYRIVEQHTPPKGNILSDFLGHSQNAILWQVWMALLAYVLIRFIGHLGQWKGTFRRLFTLLRGVLFSRLDITSVMQLYGTARGSPRMIGSPQQAYLPGFTLR